jgi:GxxExxY protein
MDFRLGRLTESIIGAAIEVHKYWGPGLTEELYERSLCHELAFRGFSCERQVTLPLLYKGHVVGDELRLDVYVEELVVVELKAVQKLHQVHSSQLLTYMRLTKSGTCQQK